MSSSPAADPSTEQILADIRRSIADIAGQTRARAAAPTRPVGAPPAAQPSATPANPPPDTSQSDSVVALRPRQVEPEGVEVAAQPAPAQAEPVPTETVPPAAAEPSEASEAPEPRYSYTLEREAQPPQPETPIMSAETDASVTRAFTGLANTLLSNETRTLEDLVREMLRPMLKTWLDNNLPPLVERLVREEIERVARSQRSP